MDEALSTEPRPEPRGPRALAFPFTVWLTVRGFLLLGAWMGMYLDPRILVPSQVHEAFSAAPFLEAWCRWDCPIYYIIARDGYPSFRHTNFFPLLPMLTHALSWVTRIPEQWAMLIVSNAATLGAYVVLYRMFRRLADEQAARWGLMLFAAYPFAFFHVTGFPESLMVLFSALSIDYALRGHHFRAGLALGMGVLARHITMLAGAGLLIAQLQQRPSPGKFLKSPAWLALALPWLFLAGYCVYLHYGWGDFLAFYVARADWGNMATWGILDHLREPDWTSNMSMRFMTAYLPFFAVLFGAVLVATRKRAWWPVAGFGLALCLTLAHMGLWGLGRYSSSIWPAFLPLGVLAAQRPNVGSLVLTGFCIFQGIFYFMFTHQFPVM